MMIIPGIRGVYDDHPMDPWGGPRDPRGVPWDPMGEPRDPYVGSHMIPMRPLVGPLDTPIGSSLTHWGPLDPRDSTKTTSRF